MVVYNPASEKKKSESVFLLGELKKCDLLRPLTDDQFDEMVAVAKRQEIKKTEFIIKEDEDGKEIFVLENGRIEVSYYDEDGTRKKLKEIDAPGADEFSFAFARSTFGEIALVFETTRTANIIAVSDCTCWTVNRDEFAAIMTNSNKQIYIDRSTFLRKIEFLNHLSDYEVAKIAHVAWDESYKKGEFIVKEKEQGDTFYIIKKGICNVYQKSGKEQILINQMNVFDHFGEKALRQANETRTASVQAVESVVELLVFHRDDVFRLIGDINDIYPERPVERIGNTTLQDYVQEEKLSIKDFKELKTLGIGGFGRVVLTQHQAKFFAQKQLLKEKVSDAEIDLEKRIMKNIKSSFIVELIHALSDRDYHYLLMEPCMGGELMALLQTKKHLPESWARFYGACTIKAIQFLHERKIVYRDIKPENLLLDSKGYAKLTDFGLARITEPGEKRWTVCGTPEYMAPELFLKSGHDFSVDYWAIGVLLYELCQGEPPFNDPKEVIKGIKHAKFPVRITPGGKSIIQSFAKQQASLRLGNLKNGFEDVFKHCWYSSFSWDKLNSRTMTAPWRPTLDHETDTRYFSSQ
ncbi:unnamed protein product [Oikopleura dioica]|uniref:cGMP-dependent protein kinase n=1 Tax=Oikopleura dioica TaxID=34765 RepID=E4X3Z7_OIKDI|nr:unnamed protein product [Oikopleura dioica]